MSSIRNVYKLGALSSLLMAFALVVGCDWTSKSDGFNTSRGRGNINFSGTYNGNLPGGRAVENTTGGVIVRLVLSQQADTLEVLDNNGSRYRGRIGSVAVIASPGDDIVTEFEDTAFDPGGFPEGTQLAQAQVSWQGHDNVAAKTIEFAGTIHAVAVTDIRGTADRASSSSVNVTTNTTTSIEQDGTNITTTITIIGFDPNTGLENFREVQTFTQTPSGQIISSDRIVDDRRSTSRDNEFILTAANTQYRLEGTWVEQGGVVAGVDALSAGAAGAIVIGSPPSATAPAQQ